MIIISISIWILRSYFLKKFWILLSSLLKWNRASKWSPKVPNWLKKKNCNKQISWVTLVQIDIYIYIYIFIILRFTIVISYHFNLINEITEEKRLDYDRVESSVRKCKIWLWHHCERDHQWEFFILVIPLTMMRMLFILIDQYFEDPFKISLDDWVCLWCWIVAKKEKKKKCLWCCLKHCYLFCVIYVRH